MTTKRAAFVIPSVALILAWGLALFMTAFAFDQPTVPARAEILRSLLAITLNAFPVIWIVTVGLVILEMKRKKMQVALTISVAASYIVCLGHCLAWVLLFTA